MRKPIVAVVGRPNVGKSTFFNRISGKRISIVEDTPGVTRDRIYTDVEWLRHQFTMIDTGGIEPNSQDVILSQMRSQAMVAIDHADVILFMIDGRAELTSADNEVAEMLRRSRKPVVLVANKIDTARMPAHFYDFYELGFGEPIAISSVNGLNLGDLLDEICSHFKDEVVEDYQEDMIKVAVIGKPNAGKSSLVNALLGEERVIVSSVPGTTREAIDTPFEKDGQKYVLIDTAGIRRKAKMDDDVEKYSVLRALTAIERADVCLLLIDAAEGITEQDKRVAGYAHEAGKAIVILVNKWDLLDKDNDTYNEFTKVVREELAYMMYAPVEFISVKTGQRLPRILEMVKYVHNQAALRVPTGTLNDIISEAILLHSPPSDKGKRLKIYYLTQVGIKPPTFVVFVNDAELAHFSYMRFIENHIRKNFNFDGSPIVMQIRQKANAL